MYTPQRLAALFLLLALIGRPVLAQNNSIISIAPDLTILLNKQGLNLYDNGYLVDHAPSNLSFGLSALRRHYSRAGKPLSFEYGLRLHKETTRLDVTGPNAERSGITLHQLGVGVPLRVFFDGWKKGKGLIKNQSGLFVELMNSANFRGDLSKNVYTSHLSLGARTKGRVVYFQIAFGWPVYTSQTFFTALDRGFAFTNNQRRFALLTLGYSLPD
ncbi:hypothetical protein CLV84_0599 [Neolewinella xylanilytica]|uniref:Outer membrane protein with beta-barrel domain n=1 Tax=Neolewinella xylanilytica TaxID=1514080 RepID=A0A2S6I835_9BACT|nr:hypothetical protein [Neolewinella xylanilytica]PPK87651.1 hypothetical protein CLV84_0599 [Neolewinella xylanilytica]